MPLKKGTPAAVIFFCIRGQSVAPIPPPFFANSAPFCPLYVSQLALLFFTVCPPRFRCVVPEKRERKKGFVKRGSPVKNPIFATQQHAVGEKEKVFLARVSRERRGYISFFLSSSMGFPNKARAAKKGGKIGHFYDRIMETNAFPPSLSFPENPPFLFLKIRQKKFFSFPSPRM